MRVRSGRRPLRNELRDGEHHATATYARVNNAVPLDLRGVPRRVYGCRGPVFGLFGAAHYEGVLVSGYNLACLGTG